MLLFLMFLLGLLLLPLPLLEKDVPDGDKTRTSNTISAFLPCWYYDDHHHHHLLQEDEPACQQQQQEEETTTATTTTMSNTNLCLVLTSQTEWNATTTMERRPHPNKDDVSDGGEPQCC
jgi:hypothetical protein